MMMQLQFFGLPPVSDQFCTVCGVRCTHESYGGYCRDCALDTGWYGCADCDVLVYDNEYTNPNGDDVCEGCYCENYFRCDLCRDTYHRDCMLCDPNGGPICEDCYGESCFFCSDCEETHWNDDGCYNCPDGLTCNDCRGGDFDPATFPQAQSYGRIGSERCYGVEVETSHCPDYESLDGQMPWGAKDDCSIDGKEFYSAILAGDEGLRAVNRLCDYANDNGWSVNRRCGTHLHLDMRSASDEELRCAALAYHATYEIWSRFVDSGRVDNRFCRAHETSAVHLEEPLTFEDFACNTQRMSWINFYAYIVHRTFEVRLLQGTIDKVLLCNWIKAHTQFVDWAMLHGYEELKDKLAGKGTTDLFDLICTEAWTDDLRNYFGKVGEFVKEPVAVCAAHACMSREE